MAGRDEAKVKFTADTSEFNSQIKQANSTLATLRAELKLNEAAFQNAGDKAEYLKKKQNLLQSEIEQSKNKQEALTNKLEAAKRIYGENSTEVQQWTQKLVRAQTEEQQLTTELNKTESELNQLETELGQSEKAFDEMGDAAEEAGNDVSGSAGGWTMLKGIVANLATDLLIRLKDALIDSAKEVVNLGTEFTASMSSVQALSGASASEMERLESVAKSLGRNTIYSATDVSDAFGYMALAGWDVSDMLSSSGGVSAVLDLAAASSMDLAKASDIVTDYITAFGLEADDAGKFVDEMAYAMSHSNTSTEQLGEAYKSCASTAKSMGFSVEDTTAALMVMANSGIKGSEAGTGLSSIMVNLATNTKECGTQLSRYGVEVYDANGNMNSLSSILTGCAGVWGDLSQQEQIALAKTIAGKTQYSKFMTIMEGVTDSTKDGVSSFKNYADALGKCDGAASEMSSTMQDNLQGDLAGMNSAAEGLGLALFDYFEGPLRGAAQTATDVLNGITDAITPQKSELEKFIDEIEQSNKNVRDALDNAESVMSGATSDVAELEAYKELLINLNGEEEKTEFQKFQVRNAVNALADSIPELAAAFDEETGAISLTNQELEDLFANSERNVMKNALISAQTEAYKALGEAELNQFKVDSALEEATRQLTEAEEKNKQTTDYQTGGYGDFYNEVLSAQIAVEDLTAEQGKNSQLIEEAQGEVDLINKAYEKLCEEAGYAEDGIAGANDELEEGSEEAAATSSAALEDIIQAYDDMYNAVSKSITDSISMLQEFSGGSEVTADDILKNLQSQITGIETWSSNMQILGEQAGNGMSQSMYDALLEMGPSSANLVQELVNTLQGDSTKFEEICTAWAEAMDLSTNAEALTNASSAGKAMSGEIASGASESESEVKDAVQEVVDGAADVDTSTVSETGTEIAEGMAEKFEGASSDISGAVEASMDESVSAVEGGVSEMASTAQSDMNDVASSFQNGMDKAKTSVTTGAQTMVSNFGKVKDISQTAQTTMSNMNRTINTGMSNASTRVSTGVAAIKTSINSLSGLGANALSDFASAVSSNMSNAASNARTYVSSLRSALNTSIKGPSIQIPHFSMSGSFNAKTNSVPTVNVSWYAKGAVFGAPTIFATPYGFKGVGEAGPEAVAPIDVLQDYVTDSVYAALNSSFLDYDKLAKALAKQPISINVGKRELGRAVRTT